MKKYDVLKKYFGHSEFRQGQSEIIDNILSGRDVLGIMPTGAGKSICYQVPALMFDGLNVINLEEATEQFCKINESLHEILERKRWQS